MALGPTILYVCEDCERDYGDGLLRDDYCQAHGSGATLHEVRYVPASDLEGEGIASGSRSRGASRAKDPGGAANPAERSDAPSPSRKSNRPATEGTEDA